MVFQFINSELYKHIKTLNTIPNEIADDLNDIDRLSDSVNKIKPDELLEDNILIIHAKNKVLFYLFSH